ncbi:MAG TPA: hypothetical protein VG672_20805 [Bryobacteraceae bacterium]|nr:hypothetical protein [Bryobacteraceae bacterium]
MSLLAPERLLGALVCCATAFGAGELPGRYFRLLDTGAAEIVRRLDAEPGAGLEKLEASRGWKHFPSAVLVAAVLYSSKAPENPRYHDRATLALAERVGDLLVSEQEKGRYNTRLDHHRDTYMWLDAYRLLESELGTERRERWKKALLQNLEPLAADVARRQDYPWYQAPFIGTSPNHYALWSSTVYLAGRVFHNPEWEKLGARVMHRFAAVEQAPDGYWGEHSQAGPTTGYDFLTETGVALYAEFSQDPAAIQALRRSTDFHKYFTYPDGMPVETINDRNRHWFLSTWGHFGFSHFGDGRRYAEFLTALYPAEPISLEGLGRIAQDALYYHRGSTTHIPLDESRFHYRMQIPAGIRKAGPWFVCLSGILAPPVPFNQFFLDRQGSLSVFHEKYGQILSGGGSKRQPELASFWEKMSQQTFHLPISSRFQMEEQEDRLALAYHSFFSETSVTIPQDRSVEIRTRITPKARRVTASMNLQVCLKAGEVLETGSGRKFTVGAEAVKLAPAELGGEIRHHGWVLKLDPAAGFEWPVYPYNPYANGPEKSLEYAVALVATPLEAREIRFSVADAADGRP